MYALSSAAVVHAAAKGCASNHPHYCGFDKNLDDKILLPGERWVGC